MTIWQILNISPTSDQRAIKRAYAKQLKNIDQEEDPTAFIQLRNALEQAQWQAQFLDEDDQNNSDDLFIPESNISSNKEIVNQPSEFIEDTPSTSENFTDPFTDAYQQLQYFIQQKASHQHISQLLKTLAQQQPTLTEDQQEKISYLLYINDLEDLYSLLAPPTEVSHPALYNIPVFENENSSYFTYSPQTEIIESTPQSVIPPLPISENSKNESSTTFAVFQPDLTTASEQSLFERSIDLSNQIYQQDFNGQTYHDFSRLLQELQHASLQEQIDIKDQLGQALLFHEYHEPLPALGQFIELWHQYYPYQQDCLDHNGINSRLQNYLETVHHQNELKQSFPENLQPAFELMLHDQKLAPFKMLMLYQHFIKKLNVGSISIFLNQTNITNRYHNANYIFLQLLEQQWSSIWWVLWAVATVAYCDTVMQLTPLALILVFIALFTGSVFLQRYLSAKLLGQEKQDFIIKNFQIIWFISGITILSITTFLPTIVHATLSYIWLFFTFVLFIAAQYFNPEPIKKFILSSQSIKADSWVIAIASSIGLIALIIIFGYTFNVSIFPHGVWNISFVLIPVGFLLFCSFFYPLFESFGHRLKAFDDEESFAQLRFPAAKQALAHCLGISLRGIWILLITFFLINDPLLQSYLFLASLTFFTLFLLMFKPEVQHSFVKYLSYISLIITTGFLSPLICIILFFVLLASMRKSRQSQTN